MSVQKTFLSGPLCFFRNDARMRTLFQKARNWKEVCLLNGTECLQFDECGGEFHEQLKTGAMTLEECSRIHDSFSAVVWREPDLKIWRKTVISERLADWNDIVEMSEDGQLSRNGQSILLYHTCCDKHRRWFRTPNVPYERVRDYHVDLTGFYHHAWQWRFRRVWRFVRYFFAGLDAARANGVSHALKRLVHVKRSGMG